jgi:molybdopterin synthase catalytic subunit
MAKELQEGSCYVALTHDHLDSTSMMDRVRSPKAGAIVLFAGKVSPTLAKNEILTF